MKIDTRTLKSVAFTSFEQKNTAFRLCDLAALTNKPGLARSKAIYRLPPEFLDAPYLDITIVNEQRVRFNGKLFRPSFIDVR